MDVWSFQPIDFEKFSWPLNIFDLGALKKKLEETLKQAILNELSLENRSILIVLFNVLINEYLSLTENLYLILFFKKEGIEIKYQMSNHRFEKTVEYINNNDVFQIYHPLLGFEPNYKKLIKNYLLNLPSVLGRNSVKSITANSFTDSFLKSSGISHSRIEPSKYFPQMETQFEQSILSSQMDKIIYSVIVSKFPLLDSLFLKGNLSFIHSYLFSKSLLFYRGIFKEVKSRQKLFAGTGANYYTRMLGRVMKDKGGELHCFEHGEGRFWYNNSEMAYTEFGIADHYYTFSPKAREALTDYCSESSLLIGHKTIHASQQGITLFGGVKRNLSSLNIRCASQRIMYVSNAFRGNKVNCEIRIHDTVYLEWQNYLFNLLKEIGYEVYVKYHPESILTNKKFMPFGNVNYLDGNFNTYLDFDGTFLFDFPMTTAFREALLSSNPVLLVYSGHPVINAKMLEVLTSRISVVRSFYDDQNRLRVSKELMKQNLDSCGDGKTKEKIFEYYGLS
jgi:hypothetical protein